jgi:hypothetical protein
MPKRPPLPSSHKEQNCNILLTHFLLFFIHDYYDSHDPLNASQLLQPNQYIHQPLTPSKTIQHYINMDQMMGAGDGGIGGQAGFPLEQWFWEMPLCTRWWTTATVLTSALVQCQIVTPFQLFYSFRAVFVKSQVCPTIRLTLHAIQL